MGSNTLNICSPIAAVAVAVVVNPVAGELTRELDDGTITVDSDSDLIDVTATLPIGIGSAIHLTDKIHLRIGTRACWYEARDSDDIDTEATLLLV